MFFVDLKTAFDKIGRDILWRELRRKGISGELIKRTEKIYEKTEVMVPTGQGSTRNFRMTKGVR